VLLEALIFKSYYGLIHHIGSPPVIGIQSLGGLWSAAEAMGNPTNPAFIPDALLPYGNRMTFYERLQNTLFWLWMRCVKVWRLSLLASYNLMNWTFLLRSAQPAVRWKHVAPDKLSCFPGKHFNETLYFNTFSAKALKKARNR